MKTAYDIIRRPVITEQSMADTENKKYVFEVAKDATKIESSSAPAGIPPDASPAGRRQWLPCLRIPSPSSSSKEWHKEVNALWLLRATSPQRLPAGI